jgi:hypothetical protein
MEQDVQGTPSAEKLVEVYLRIRDASEDNYRSYMAKKADLEEQLDIVQTELLDILKNVDATSLRTSHGLARRSVKQRYTTNDWERFHKFILEHNAPELLERRIQQTNMKQFLDENPDLHPAGLNVDSTYAITVTRRKS